MIDVVFREGAVFGGLFDGVHFGHTAVDIGLDVGRDIHISPEAGGCGGALGCAFEDEDVFTARVVGGVVVNGVGEGHTEDLFVEFREFTADGDAATLSKGGEEIREGVAELVGGFMEEHGARFLFEELEMHTALGFIDR